MNSTEKQQFIKIFNRIASHKHRYLIFSDFITMSAIALHNAVNKSESLEQEYLKIVGGYERPDIDRFCQLLACTINLLEDEPRDILGVLCMELELGNEVAGQFFTPPDISKMMAKIIYGDKLKALDMPFISLSEPACGSGGMVLAFVHSMLEEKHNPAEKLWVQCIDIDRVAALMCYIQLSLWNIPAEIVVGNTLSLQFREVLYTPAYYLNNWRLKLEERERLNSAKKIMGSEEILMKNPPNNSSNTTPYFETTKINTEPHQNNEPLSIEKKEPKIEGQVDMFDL